MNEKIEKPQLYQSIKRIIEETRATLLSQSNALLIQMNWNIGRLIVEDEQNGAAKAAYGEKVLRNLSQFLTLEFGKGFDERNLNNMRAFYLAFPHRDAMRHELSWTHYRIISRVENAAKRC